MRNIYTCMYITDSFRVMYMTYICVPTYRYIKIPTWYVFTWFYVILVLRSNFGQLSRFIRSSCIFTSSRKSSFIELYVCYFNNSTIMLYKRQNRKQHISLNKISTSTYTTWVKIFSPMKHDYRFQKDSLRDYRSNASVSIHWFSKHVKNGRLRGQYLQGKQIKTVKVKVFYSFFCFASIQYIFFLMKGVATPPTPPPPYLPPTLPSVSTNDR